MDSVVSPSDMRRIEVLLVQSNATSARVRTRLQIIAELGEKTLPEIAKQVGVSLPTVYHWKKVYIGDGLDAVLSPQRSRKSPTEGIDTRIEISPRRIETVKKALLMSDHFVRNFVDENNPSSPSTILSKQIEKAKQVLAMPEEVPPEHSEEVCSSHDLDDGKATVSMDDVAQAAGVSKMSVSRALTGKNGISEQNRERIRAIAEKMGYEHSPYVSFFQSYVRSRKRTMYQGSIGWVDDWDVNNKNWWGLPYNKILLDGAKKQAKQLGFSLDIIQLGLGNLRMSRNYKDGLKQLIRVARARGIYGIILPHLYFSSLQLADWEDFAVVTIGDPKTNLRRVRADPSCAIDALPEDPRFYDSVVSNYGENFLTLWDKILSAGYRRPGFAISIWQDYNAGLHYRRNYKYLSGMLPAKNRIPQLIASSDEAEAKLEILQYCDRYQPDILIVKHKDTIKWLEYGKISVPSDIAVVHLGITPDIDDWSGINSQRYSQGESAVDLVVSQLRNGVTETRRDPRQTLIAGTWQDGWTMPVKEAILGT